MWLLYACGGFRENKQTILLSYILNYLFINFLYILQHKHIMYVLINNNTIL